MDTLKLSGFKRFESLTIPINRITLLTGNNGSGKSSVIQSLLLLRQYIEQLSVQPDVKTIELKLNGYRELALGTFDDIANNDSVNPVITLNGISIILDEADDRGHVSAIAQAGSSDTIPPLMSATEFRYLNAERIGPRQSSELPRKKLGFTTSGTRGEYAGNALLETSISFPKLDRKRFCPGQEAPNFNIQVDNWMSYIFGDTSVKTEKISEELCRIVLRDDRNSRYVVAPNTGFGITYALPVIIDGLAAAEGSFIIVENPEAHLHPKAQSNIGFFLGCIAAAGVKILIETHSEHVVNGVRRAIFACDGITHDDFTINFFPQTDTDSNAPVTITMDDNGNLSDFPVDFFDQVRQDMLEIIRLSAEKK